MTSYSTSHPKLFSPHSKVIANAQTLCDGLISRGYKVSTGGTDNHMLLLDLSNKKLSGAKGERILEEIAISCNKNTGKRTRSCY